MRPRFSPEKLNQVEQCILDGRSLRDTAKIATVSYSYANNVRRRLINEKRLKEIPLNRRNYRKPREIKIPKDYVPPKVVELSESFLTKAAYALESSKNRHLSPEAWELVTATSHACRELIAIRRDRDRWLKSTI